VSDNVAGCGGTAAKRLQGAPNDAHYSIAVISAGKDRTFQTSCNAYVDANADNIPDVSLLDKPSGSDDLILGYTYAEASNLGNGLWTLKEDDSGTATIDKDIEVEGGATLGGALILGGGLLLPDQTSSGLCAEANDQQLRRNTSTPPPALEICDWQGGSGDWAPIGGGGGGADNLGNHTATTNIKLGANYVSYAGTAAGLSLDASNDATFSGNVRFAGVLTDISDLRLKREVAPLGRSLDKVVALDGISFVMKGGTQREYGFGAQDVQKIYPELVMTATDERHTLSVNYLGLIAPMVEAIKELKAENGSLRARIDRLERDGK
jgi:hypothetical protein